MNKAKKDYWHYSDPVYQEAEIKANRFNFTFTGALFRISLQPQLISDSTNLLQFLYVLPGSRHQLFHLCNCGLFPRFIADHRYFTAGWHVGNSHHVGDRSHSREVQNYLQVKSGILCHQRLSFRTF